jgi:alkylation response protein AidB-like acyl-CoA dehydrogenase
MAMAGLDGGRLSIGACSLGAAQACFEIALGYVKVQTQSTTSEHVSNMFYLIEQERKQFKKSIADYQATQFKLADMAGKILESRLMLR